MEFWRKLKQTHVSPSRKRALKWRFYYRLNILALLMTISMSGMDFSIIANIAYMYLKEALSGSLFHTSKPLQNLPPRPLCARDSIKINTTVPFE